VRGSAATRAAAPPRTRPAPTEQASLPRSGLPSARVSGCAGSMGTLAAPARCCKRSAAALSGPSVAAAPRRELARYPALAIACSGRTKGRGGERTRSFASIGRLMKYPWARSQPTARRRSRVARSSTPSATTRIASAWPNSIVARTSARSRPKSAVARPVMNVRSSLSSLTARLPRYASDVNPAPKSSSETPSPRSRSC
jgi:hypothetical protein